MERGGHGGEGGNRRGFSPLEARHLSGTATANSSVLSLLSFSPLEARHLSGTPEYGPTDRHITGFSPLEARHLSGTAAIALMDIIAQIIVSVLLKRGI